MFFPPKKARVWTENILAQSTHNILKKSLHRIDAILAGYNLPDERMKNRIQKW